jgi:CPA2 family monovalent cation:H+ antiporter-2
LAFLRGADEALAATRLPVAENILAGAAGPQAELVAIAAEPQADGPSEAAVLETEPAADGAAAMPEMGEAPPAIDEVVVPDAEAETEAEAEAEMAAGGAADAEKAAEADDKAVPPVIPEPKA